MSSACVLSSSVASLVETSCAQLHGLYTHIGISEGDQAVLMADLEEKLRAACGATIKDAQEHVHKLTEEIAAQAAAIARVAHQLQHNEPIAQVRAHCHMHAQVCQQCPCGG